MRMCLKCSKKVSDNSKICRDCGAILQDVPDNSVVVATAPPEPSIESGLPVAAEWQAAESSAGNEQSFGEVVADLGKPRLPDTRASAWTCPQCGESVPGTFDVCWKCSTTEDGEKAGETEPEFFQEEPDSSKPEKKGMPSQSVCPRCGSAKMMFGVTVCDQGEYSGGTLQVMICGDPSALVFKDRLYGKLKANICGDCGHVELRVANPKELYRHYRKSSR
ncbi:MAG: hypothetical protein ACYC0X_01430 [Pirellulaceae bacterium]